MTAISYTDLFQTRGEKYESAMQRFPRARDMEFEQTVALASFTQGSNILDVPAGGGYLQHYLPAHCSYHAHEPCSTFGHSSNDTASELLPLPYLDNSTDITFSLAGVHHIENKLLLFSEIDRVTANHGQLILADVYKDSAVAHFLDDFVGQNNSTGHDGIYLDDTTLEELSSCNWQVVSANRKPVYWSFTDEIAMAEFCRSLFDLRDVNNQDVLAAIDDILGINNQNGIVSLNWELFYISALRQ